MECNKIKIRNFRNIEETEIAFDSGVNILTGANAQGKTNLLEAIGFASIGKSFRTSHEEELIRFGEEFCEISMDYSDSVRKQNITVRMMKGKRRRIEHNRVKVTKLSEVVGSFRTVLFCPEHLSLIKDGPGERRNYLDLALSQLYPVYLKSLQRYQQILKQRNQLLKTAEDDRRTFSDTIEFWSSQLAAEAAVNPNTMQKALMLLEDEGLLHAQGTVGRFVTTDDAVLNKARENIKLETVRRLLTDAYSVGISPSELIRYIQKEEMDK